jgi:hypothetical protein
MTWSSFDGEPLHNMEVVYSLPTLKKIDILVKPIDGMIKLHSQESQKLEQLKGLLLSRMASIEKNSTFATNNNRVFTGRNTNVATI